jgi:ribosomal silencing factor RsfS
MTAVIKGGASFRQMKAVEDECEERCEAKATLNLYGGGALLGLLC